MRDSIKPRLTVAIREGEVFINQTSLWSLESTKIERLTLANYGYLLSQNSTYQPIRSRYLIP